MVSEQDKWVYTICGGCGYRSGYNPVPSINVGLPHAWCPLLGKWAIDPEGAERARQEHCVYTQAQMDKALADAWAKAVAETWEQAIEAVGAIRSHLNTDDAIRVYATLEAAKDGGK